MMHGPTHIKITTEVLLSRCHLISESIKFCCKVCASLASSYVKSNSKDGGECRIGGTLPRRENLNSRGEKTTSTTLSTTSRTDWPDLEFGATTLGGRRLTTWVILKTDIYRNFVSNVRWGRLKSAYRRTVNIRQSRTRDPLNIKPPSGILWQCCINCCSVKNTDVIRTCYSAQQALWCSPVKGKLNVTVVTLMHCCHGYELGPCNSKPHFACSVEGSVCLA